MIGLRGWKLARLPSFPRCTYSHGWPMSVHSIRSNSRGSYVLVYYSFE